jgi:phosphoglycolate phosphatase-like HAD superfamily hydrolase
MAAQSAFKLVALDMDGTLLDNNHCISHENRSILLDLHDRFGFFCVSSACLDVPFNIFVCASVALK